MNNLFKKEVELVGKKWGYEKIIVNNDKYCGKLLHIVKGHGFSAHYHIKKDETFFLAKGKLEVWFYDDVKYFVEFINNNGDSKIFNLMDKIILEEGESFHVPPYRIHMVHALVDSEMYEFSDHHEDSDSIRLTSSY